MVKKYTKLNLYLFYSISAIIYILAYYNEQYIITSLAKPIPILLLIFSINNSSYYNKLITSGLVFSLVGDILLMKTVGFFFYGLISFLIAHIFYIIGFINKSNRIALISSLPFYAYAIAIFIFLKPALDDMIVPVSLYILVISTMLWRSFVQRNKEHYAYWAFIGALFFTVSDSLIAISRFYNHFFLDTQLIMSTYWIAQLFIFLSTTQNQLTTKKIA